MNNLFKVILCLVLVAVSGKFALAQSDDIRETNMTSMDQKIDKKKEGPEKKKLIQIIKPDTKGILYGNRCFEEVTNEMGFEYVVQPPGQPGNRTPVGRFFHNFGAKFKLFFKAGPTWKSKVKKKVKECRELSGDYVG